MDHFLDIQKLLNHSSLSKRKVKRIIGESDREPLHIACYRTMPFEYMEELVALYMQWSCEKTASFSYSSYDASLSGLERDSSFRDATIFWLDWRLYREQMTPSETVHWFIQQIHHLSENGPIFVNNWPACWEMGDSFFSGGLGQRAWYRSFNQLLVKELENEASVQLIDLDYLASVFGLASYDLRNDQVSSFPLSHSFSNEVARHLGLQLFPAVYMPRLKLIVLDLDHTLYQGVLGEDGVEGIVFTEAHQNIQKSLLRLKDSGVLLAIASKNDLSDVETLFTQHPECLLQLDDFISIQADWNEKSSNVEDILNLVNIDASAALFIDDNPVELAKMKGRFPSIHLIQATSTGEDTLARLTNYPYLYALEFDEFATARQRDIEANVKRAALENEAKTPTDYLNDLKMKVTCQLNEPSHIRRAAELSRKTNQFNSSFQRYSLSQLESLVNQRLVDVWTVRLKDRLSDSGIVGSIVVEPEGDHLYIQELVISCRALGRHVEDLALRHILQFYQSSMSVRMEVEVGERNEPFLQWVDSLQLNKKEVSKDELIERLNQKLKPYQMEVVHHGKNEGSIN